MESMESIWNYLGSVKTSRQQDAKSNPEGIASYKPQDIPLHLPSSYKFRTSLQQPELCLYELRLREGQAHDTLHEMRQHLRVRTHLYKQKDKYVQGVRHNTHANSAINKCQAKVDRAAEKYCASRNAMLSLSDPLVVLDWNDTLHVLKAEDVRVLSEALMGDSEGKQCLSWIWTMNMGVVGGSADQAGDEGAYLLILSHLQELSTCNSSTSRMVSLSCSCNAVHRGGGALA